MSSYNRIEMYAIKQQSDERKLTPNLLPCSIRHDGPIPVDKRYWNPTSDRKHDQMAYFRGRKLEGSVIEIPDGYQGVLLQKSDERVVEKPTIPMSAIDDDNQADLTEPSIETKLFSQQATFDELVIWGHETVPEAEDAYVKGIKEWVAFAETLHSFEDPGTNT